ncbi:MAG: hypothetical protein ABJ081_08520 [Hyphomicrobiales bacterium]
MMDIFEEALKKAAKDVGGFPIVCNVASAFVHLTKTRTTTGFVRIVDGGNVAAMMRWEKDDG